MRRLIFLTLVVLAVALPALAQPYSTTNPGIYWVPPGACNSTVSGSSTGTNGLTVTGASTTPVVQAQTTGAVGVTHTFICNISPPQSIKTTRVGFAILDAVFVYGTTAELAPTQANVLASGTFNGAIVFSQIVMPAPGTSETPSSVTPVRADTGTMVITPTLANFNKTTTTAGAFFTIKFTPSTPIAWKTDLQQLLLTVTIKTGGLATITTSPGVLVHIVSK